MGAFDCRHIRLGGCLRLPAYATGCIVWVGVGLFLVFGKTKKGSRLPDSNQRLEEIYKIATGSYNPPLYRAELSRGECLQWESNP